MSRLGEAALAYAAKGKPVFPIKPGGKTPLTPNGFKDATTDPEKVAWWWSGVRWPDANIGMPTGAASGFLVLDVDGAPGYESLAKLEAEHGQALDTLESGTPSGGAHLWFVDPGGIGNSAGKLGPGLDVRGDGGYVLVPPSVRPEGRYEWCEDPAPAMEVPAWLLALLRPPARPVRPVPVPSFGHQRDRYWQAALRGELHDLAVTPEGQRNNRLNAAAFAMGQLVAGAGAPVEPIRTALELAGQALGLPAAEVAKTVASGLVAGEQQPRGAA